MSKARSPRLDCSTTIGTRLRDVGWGRSCREWPFYDGLRSPICWISARPGRRYARAPATSSASLALAGFAAGRPWRGAWRGFFARRVCAPRRSPASAAASAFARFGSSAALGLRAASRLWPAPRLRPRGRGLGWAGLRRLGLAAVCAVALGQVVVRQQLFLGDRAVGDLRQAEDQVDDLVLVDRRAQRRPGRWGSGAAGRRSAGPGRDSASPRRAWPGPARRR